MTRPTNCKLCNDNSCVMMGSDINDPTCYAFYKAGPIKAGAYTNADRIRGMSDEELAKASLYFTTEPDYDEDDDGYTVEFGVIETWQSVFTDDRYACEDDAIAYVLDYLKQPAETEWTK